MHTPHTDTVETHPRAQGQAAGGPRTHAGTATEPHSAQKSDGAQHRSCEPRTRGNGKIEIKPYITALVFVLKCWTYENSDL